MEETAVRMVAVDSVAPSQDNPRASAGDVSELAVSIQSVGIIEPLIVRSTGEDSYVLIAGERRLTAAKSVGLASFTHTFRARSPSVRERSRVPRIMCAAASYRSDGPSASRAPRRSVASRNRSATARSPSSRPTIGAAAAPSSGSRTSRGMSRSATG